MTNNIRVSFDLVNNRIKGESRISGQKGSSANVNIEGLRVLSASINGRQLNIETGAEDILFTPVSDIDILTISYEAEFKNPPESRAANPGVVKGSLVSPEGIMLIDNWYPSTQNLSLINLSALMPAGFEAISEADEITIKPGIDGSREFSFLFEHPRDTITLVAGRYSIETEKFNNITLSVYSITDDKDIAKKYIEFTKKYLDMYEKLLSEYPFKRFAVVENILSTGYSMPTFTLLGKDVMRLPFITETSLGHEVLHQWFGNMVYSARQGGNWTEGLTTYLADHLYEEMKGAGSDYRKQALISFQSAVNDENDFPLNSFSGRNDRASSAIGYGKAAIVFHMLKNITGEEKFYKALREFILNNSFRYTSWTEIQLAFEKASGKDLGWFFKQWIETKGALDFSIKDVLLRYYGSKAVVSFELRQRAPAMKFHIPVLLKMETGELLKMFETDKEVSRFEIETDGMPVELVIDENYDIFRKLSDSELPPVISRLLGDKNKIFVLPSGKGGEHAETAQILKGRGFIEKKEEDLKYDDIKNSSLFIPGIETSIAKRLFGKIEMPKGDFFLNVMANPYNRKHVIALADSSLSADKSKYMERITHYNKYSRLVFEGGKNILKEIEKSGKGMHFDINSGVMGVEVRALKPVSEIMERAGSKDIIYVGELHERFDHHRVQLQVIRDLYKKNKKIAIGMEMFQKPFQKVLDDFISGAVSEKEMLKKTEYFKRWTFDYNLYREILLFARENRIPVVALNIRKEIVSKVSKEGIQSLTSEEMKEVPEDMDLSDADYRDRLREFFKKHANSETRNFDFFYQAQVLWDEAMAHSIDEYLNNHPEHQMIVLAGGGHLSFGSGIPKRAYRLNRRDYSIILNSDDIEENVADFILMPESIPTPESPKLMVLLKEEEDKVKIIGFAPESVSEKAGLETDDFIISLDDAKIESIDDLKIFLFDRKKGDSVTIKVSRSRFLLGRTEKEFKVVL